MLDRVFEMRDMPQEESAARPARPRVQLFQQFDRESRVWQPTELPLALPCRLTTYHEGKPVMGNAVVDAHMPSDLPLPLELVPPEEAVQTAPHIIRNGGYLIFSDDYVHKYPQSKVADMVRQFGAKKDTEIEKLKQEHGLVEVAEIAELPEDDDYFTRNTATTTTTTAGPTPSTSSVASAATSMTSAPKNKVQQVREFLQEAEKVDRPLFRRQDPTAVYGQAKYGKRNFHAIMDDEYPIEYII